MVRHISEYGLEKIRQWEGLKLEAYDDGGGVLTIGYGHTTGVYQGMRITPAQAEQFLISDLKPCEHAVETYVEVGLSDNQFAALVSFVFNVGVEAFKKSTLLKKLNSGDYDSVPGELSRWNKDNGKVVQGLVNRRAAEAGLWARGSYVSTSNVDVKPTTTPVISLENAAFVAPIAYGGVSVASELDNGSPITWVIAAGIGVCIIIGTIMFLRRRRAV